MRDRNHAIRSSHATRSGHASRSRQALSSGQASRSRHPISSGYATRSHAQRRPRRGFRALAASALACVLLFPMAADAQTGVRLLPQVGVYAPLDDFGQVRDDGRTLVDAGRASATLAWGLGIEAGPAAEGTSLRLQAMHGTRSNVPVGGFECQGCTARSTLLTASVAAVHRPLPRMVVVQPHLVLGVGVKRYDFEVRDMDGDSWRIIFEDQTRLSGQLGVGMEVSVLGLRTQWELNGVMSRYHQQAHGDFPEDRSLQTDFFLTLGIPIGG